MDKIVYKEKGQFKNKPAAEIMLTDELSVIELIERLDIYEAKIMDGINEMRALNEAYQHLTAFLKDKVIFEGGQTIIAQIDGELQRLKLDKVFPDMPINLKFYKVVNGQLVEDKSKILEMI